ncbi:MAG: 30S ribosomal protein S8 [Xanthobacteraceae bacterium]|jgi:small subunit ribosomal protein S8
MMNDPLGDLLSRIRNAQMRNKSKVSSPNSRLREHVLDVLQSEGYIRGYAVVEREGRSEIEIELKYFEGEPVIREIARISKPGRRVYASVKNLPRINNGLGVAIVSTPKGVMADHDARDANVGGEVLCTVF